MLKFYVHYKYSDEANLENILDTFKKWGFVIFKFTHIVQQIKK